MQSVSIWRTDRGPGALTAVSQEVTPSGLLRGTFRKTPGGLAAVVDPAIRALQGHYRTMRLASGQSGLERIIGLRGVDDDGIDTRFVPLSEQGYRLQREQVVNETLMALFHNAPDFVPAIAVNDSPDWRQAWKEYKNVNRQFDKSTASLKRSKGAPLAAGATIVDHDVHLALAHGDVLFIHVPTPRPEVFELLPLQVRKELLTAMAGRKVVAVHTDKHRDRLLDCFDQLGIKAPTIVRSPAQLDITALREEAKQPDIAEGKKWVTEKLRAQGADADTKVITMLARMDYTKGFLAAMRQLQVLIRTEPGLAQGTRVLLGFPENSRDYGEYRKYAIACQTAMEDVNKNFREATGQDSDFIIHVPGDERHLALAAIGEADVFLSNVFEAGLEVTWDEAYELMADTGVVVGTNGAGAAEQYVGFMGQRAALIFDSPPIYPNTLRDPTILQGAAAIKEALTLSDGEARAINQAGRSIVGLRQSRGWAETLGQHASDSPLAKVLLPANRDGSSSRPAGTLEL